MPSDSTSKLFTPLRLGGGKDAFTLSHRIVLAPLTRNRSPNHVPGDLSQEYYSQRTTPGGFLVTEGTHPSRLAGSYDHVPGIYTDEQVAGWKKVTSAVHEKGGIIFMQIWHVGRLTHSFMTGSTPKAASASVGPVDVAGYAGTLPEGASPEQPEEMTVEEIHQTTADWARAAERAIEAGFDGVEVHAAGGYLLDQFLEDNLNLRTDAYGGSIENRARFLLEILDAVIAKVGAARVGTRFSSFLFFNGAGGSDPVRQFQYVFQEVEKRGIAYAAMVEPNLSVLDLWTGEEDGANIGRAAVNSLKNMTRTNWTRLEQQALESGVKKENLREYLSLASFQPYLKKTPLLAVGGYDGKTATVAVEEGKADAICFGRWFISNPDLVDRVKHGRELAKYNRDTFYTHTREGYTDYPTWKE